VDSTADSAAQVRACLLIRSEMYPTINARVGDIVGDLLKGGVSQSDAGHCRIRQRDRLPAFAVKTSHHRRCAIGRAAVVRGIAGDGFF
jgi:hypothetical protein